MCLDFEKGRAEVSKFDIDAYRSATDGIFVIHVDTPRLPENENGPVCRIYLNEHCLYENPPFPNPKLEVTNG